MVLPPPLDFRLGPAFAFDYILRLEVNGKMTERLQIGNVLRAMVSWKRDGVSLWYGQKANSKVECQKREVV
jgi:hypothetical protein